MPVEITLRVMVSDAEATTAEELGELEDQLSKMASALLAMRRAQREVNLKQLAKLFVGDISPSQVDVTRLSLEAQAYRQITNGGPWVAEAEVAVLAGLRQSNPLSTLNRWRKTGRIFAIQRNDRNYFPLYGLGRDFRPAPAMAKVMKILPWPAEQLAAWFESTSSFLDGRRPREVFADNPELVLQAAKDARADQVSG